MEYYIEHGSTHTFRQNTNEKTNKICVRMHFECIGYMTKRGTYRDNILRNQNRAFNLFFSIFVFLLLYVVRVSLKVRITYSRALIVFARELFRQIAKLFFFMSFHIVLSLRKLWPTISRDCLRFSKKDRWETFECMWLTTIKFSFCF